jgi:hypothetical protein
MRRRLGEQTQHCWIPSIPPQFIEFCDCPLTMQTTCIGGQSSTPKNNGHPSPELLSLLSAKVRTGKNRKEWIRHAVHNDSDRLSRRIVMNASRNLRISNSSPDRQKCCTLDIPARNKHLMMNVTLEEWNEFMHYCAHFPS